MKRLEDPNEVFGFNHHLNGIMIYNKKKHMFTYREYYGDKAVKELSYDRNKSFYHKLVINKKSNKVDKTLFIDIFSINYSHVKYEKSYKVYKSEPFIPHEDTQNNEVQYSDPTVDLSKVDVKTESTVTNITIFVGVLVLILIVALFMMYGFTRIRRKKINQNRNKKSLPRKASRKTSRLSSKFRSRASDSRSSGSKKR